jgi:hypothetical protein
MRRFEALAVFTVSFALAAGCGSSADPEAAAAASAKAPEIARVAADGPPPGYVATPHGYYHASCVHTVPNGADMDVSTGRVTLAGGAELDLPACAYPAFRPHAGAEKPVTDGWVEYTSYTSTAPATKMRAAFDVPTAPTSRKDQIVYFFPGMEPADGTIILQPVLGWSQDLDGGADQWTVASWSCGPSCVHSAPLAVAAGDALEGTIAGTKCTTSAACNWAITTSDTTSGKSTTLHTHKDKHTYVWLFGGVLEAYQVKACAEYPASGTETFSAVDFYDQAGDRIDPTFTTTLTGARPTCSFGATPSPKGAVLTF